MVLDVWNGIAYTDARYLVYALAIVGYVVWILP